MIASAGALGYFDQQGNSVHKSLQLLLLPANGPAEKAHLPCANEIAPLLACDLQMVTGPKGS